jgi:hypothetical protein
MHTITNIQPIGEYKLLATFENGEQRVRDLSDLVAIGKVFEPLRNPGFFKTVKLVYGAPTWFVPGSMEVDLCPDSFYLDSEPWEG